MTAKMTIQQFQDAIDDVAKLLAEIRETKRDILTEKAVAQTKLAVVTDIVLRNNLSPYKKISMLANYLGVE